MGKARKCMNSNGKAKCGNCPKGYTNLGATKCKKAAAPTTTKSSGKANFVLGSYNKLCSGGLTPVNSETDSGTMLNRSVDLFGYPAISCPIILRAVFYFSRNCTSIKGTLEERIPKRAQFA